MRGDAGGLEAKNVLVAEAHGLQRGAARLVKHHRRPAHDTNAILGSSEERGPRHVFINEAHEAFPLLPLPLLCRRADVRLSEVAHLVHGKGQPEAVRMLRCEFFQSLACQDVIRCAVGVQESHLGRVLWVSQDRREHLIAWREARAARNHRNLRAEAWLSVHSVVAFAFVHKFADGALYIDAVSNLHGVQVLGHLAAFREVGMHALEVHLHQEVHVAQRAVISHRRVGPHHWLAVNLRLERHMQACGQAQPHGCRQRKAEDASVVVDHNLL
mmetsp:Transcript_43626/g.104011  ORF Transcript_43626/g.104011 Transcript_43626/m.104011 type:complete len:271 (-) Transcript_43626:1696-2508(-)